MATGLENLWIYKLAEDLEIEVYKMSKKFPREELYRTVDQLLRSSASVANNIAESYHKSTVKEKNRFPSIAKGEIEETRRNIQKSSRKRFITKEASDFFVDKYTILIKGINSYIKFLTLNQLVKSKPKTN